MRLSRCVPLADHTVLPGLCAVLTALCWLAPVQADDYRATPVPLIAARQIGVLDAGFTYPSDVAVGSDDTVYVLDGVNNRIAVYSPEGEFMRWIEQPGALDTPLGLDVSPQGTLVVADSGNHRLVRMRADGPRMEPVAIACPPRSPPCDPVDVAVDHARKRYYIVDNDNHRIIVQDFTGKLIAQWGSYGEKPGQFQYPFLIAGDARGDLYVVDVLNTRVQVLNAAGRTISIIGRWGIDRGQFYRPKGVALGPDDTIFVSDSYTGVIQVFRRYRTFLGVLATTDGSLMRLAAPTGMAIDSRRRLYVVEMAANRVSIFQLRGEQ